MSASAAQIAANRLNARHSTGPVTDSGKARSSRNAAGPIAKFLVMTEEDEEELAYLIETYIEKIRPINQIETDLVADMAVARWRRLRLLEFEASLISHTMDKVREELGPEAARAHIQAVALERLIDGSKTWNTLQRYMRDAERTYNACLKQLTVAPSLEVSRPAKPHAEPVRPAAVLPRKNEPDPVPSLPSRFGPNVPLRPNGYPVNLALAL